MTEHLVRALAALDRLDASPDMDEEAAIYLLEEAHCDIARGLGLTVFEPTNFPHFTVSEDENANPYATPHEVSALPDYSEDFDDAVELAPEGYSLVQRKIGKRWKAAFIPDEQAEPDEKDWQESTSATRAIARAALAARLATHSLEAEAGARPR